MNTVEKIALVFIIMFCAIAFGGGEYHEVSKIIATLGFYAATFVFLAGEKYKKDEAK